MTLTVMFQSGLCSSSELETSRGSIRIQHLTGANHHPPTESSAVRFHRLEECAHFHYEFTEIGPLQVREHQSIFQIDRDIRVHNIKICTDENGNVIGS